VVLLTFLDCDIHWNPCGIAALEVHYSVDVHPDFEVSLSRVFFEAFDGALFYDKVLDAVIQLVP